jgi:riboflavin biosynthesis pyrimidine reductase
MRLRALRRLLKEKISGWAAGVATIREYLRAGLVDEMQAYAPVLLGSGEGLLEGMDLLALGFELNAHIATANSMHMLIAKKNLL